MEVVPTFCARGSRISNLTTANKASIVSYRAIASVLTRIRIAGIFGYKKKKKNCFRILVNVKEILLTKYL